ncbi:MAG: hypothetical protein V4710_00155, partial [Verrucomicrobiota bacterium]
MPNTLVHTTLRHTLGALALILLPVNASHAADRTAAPSLAARSEVRAEIEKPKKAPASYYRAPLGYSMTRDPDPP